MRKSLFLASVPALVGMFLVASPVPAEAQYYGYQPAPPHPANPMHRPRFSYKHRTHGYIGAQLVGMAVIGQRLDSVGTLSHGGGFGLYAGIRFNAYISLDASWMWTFHDEIWGDENGHPHREVDTHQIHSMTADLKIHIPTWSRVEPFLQVGGGWAFFGMTGYDPYYDTYNGGYLYANGPAFNAGGGVTFWVNPHFTIGGRLLYRGMYFFEPEYDIYDSNGNLIGRRSDLSNYVNAVTADFHLAFHF